MLGAGNQKQEGPSYHHSLSHPDTVPEGPHGTSPALRPQEILSGYIIVISAGFAEGIYFLKLFDQVGMFSNPKNNTDGVCHICENKFRILF